MNRPWIDPAMLERIVPTRDLTEQLGDYFVTHHPAEPVDEIRSRVVGLSPNIWPRCLHCGGDVNCPDYDPDTKGEVE